MKTNNVLNIVKPYPGTKEAGELGCICPVIDNNYGRGHHGIAGEFVINMECSLHTMPLEELAGMMGITPRQD